MENKQMYVITMETGSYDDYGVRVVAVTDDFAKGKAYVDNKNQVFQSMDKKVRSFYQKEYAVFARNNPKMIGYKEFSEEWAKNHLTEEELELYPMRNENYWEIEPVEWL